MKILLVSATDLEIKPLLSHFSFNSNPNYKNHTFEWIVTGVGMINTTYQLAKHFETHEYDLAINIGIAGAFDRDLNLGEVVRIKSDLFSEIGAEDDDNFLSLVQLGFQEPNEFPYKWGELTPKETTIENQLQRIKKVRAITVNKAHGKLSSILATQKHFNPQIESMEGAAFYFCCMNEKIPCIQIRSISNYVEKRNRDAWEIQKAIKNVNDFMIDLIENLPN